LQEEKRKIGWVTIDIVLVIVLNNIILYKNLNISKSGLRVFKGMGPWVKSILPPPRM
jgi:hypothetical protein